MGWYGKLGYLVQFDTPRRVPGGVVARRVEMSVLDAYCVSLELKELILCSYM